MPMKMLVTCGDIERTVPMKELEDKIPAILGALGPDKKIKLLDQALELEEVLNSTLESIKNSIQHESKLTVEISGSLKLGGNVEGGAKFFIFNLGAKTVTEMVNNMRISLETTIKPRGNG